MSCFFRWRSFVIWALLSLGLIPGTFCQTPYLLSDPKNVHRLDAFAEVFIDPSDTFSIDDIVARENQIPFHRNKGNLTFGYLKATIWLKFQIRTDSPNTDWLLEIPAPYLEYVDFYQKNGEEWQASQSGYYRPHSVRLTNHTGHVLPLTFAADSTAEIYVRIAGRSPKTFPAYVFEKEKFHNKVRVEDVGYGVFFGILIVMFFYNLFIYLTLKLTNYLLYICTIVCTFLIFSSASGYAGKFLWPENPDMNFYAGRLTLGVLAIFLSIFTIRFLEVKRYSRFMYYALFALIPLGALSIMLVVTRTLSSAGNNLISIAALLYMITGIVCRIKGNKTANYFIAAWTVYLVGGLMLTLRNSGVFDFNFWTTHLVEIGAALETVIIAFALGDRYRRLRIEKEEAQLLALKLQQDVTGRLELKVRERTEQLSIANDELKATLETNKLQTRIIESKNAELDAFFYRISHDLKGPIRSLLALTSLARQDIRDLQAQLYIEKQHRQVERLSHIINGLINLTKLDHTDLQKEKIDFNKIIDECVAACNGLPNFSMIDFKKSIQPGIEFSSEWTLLTAIFQNLIENAVKYAGEEHPYVAIDVRQERSLLRIEVADNGHGIEQEHQSRIFDMFYRATQKANGTGLGLYILKRSVERLQGTIEIESKPGVGSRFIVTLPFIG
jgi:signal transduction histidine kinase